MQSGRGGGVVVSDRLASVKHGGGWAYSVGCRCVECVEAWNARHRDMRARRAETVAERTDLEHGTRSTYSNYGCRREACVRAQSEANRRRPSRAQS